jgi:hypothetical protein
VQEFVGHAPRHVQAALHGMCRGGAGEVPAAATACTVCYLLIQPRQTARGYYYYYYYYYSCSLTWVRKLSLKYLFELSSFKNTSYCETAHRFTPYFFGVCLLHIYIIILHLMRPEYYYPLLFSHPTFPFMFNFVQIFS